MIGRHLKAVPLLNLAEHGLQRGVANFPLLAALATDKVVMGFGSSYLIVGFIATGIGRQDQAQLHEQM